MTDSGGSPELHYLSGPRGALGCLFFLAGIGLMTLLVSLVFGFLWALEWAWGLR